MSNNATKRTSRTDWERLGTMSDEDIDYTDIPPLDDEFFQREKLYVPQNRAVILEPDVFTRFINQE